MIQKSNRIPAEQVELVCQEVGITHKEFDDAVSMNGTLEAFEAIIGDHIVGYEEQYLEECEGKFGITLTLVRNALKFPDHTQEFVAPGAIVQLFAKKIEKSEDYLLVQVKSQNDNAKIEFAYRIKAELVKEVNTTEPVKLLTALATKFGFLVKVGEVQSKIFVNTKIPMPEGSFKFSFQGSGRMFGMLQAHVIEDEGKKAINVEIAYSINLADYEKWLGY